MPSSRRGCWSSAALGTPRPWRNHTPLLVLPEGEHPVLRFDDEAAVLPDDRTARRALRAALAVACETIPPSVDARADARNDPAHPGRTAVAQVVRKLAGPLPLVPAEPTDPDEFVRERVEAERDRLRDRSDDLDALDGRPGCDAHERAVRTRLARLAGPTDPPAAPPCTPTPRSALTPSPGGGDGSPAGVGRDHAPHPTDPPFCRRGMMG